MSADLVVVSALKKWACTSCGGTGDLLKMEDGGPLCVDCADLGHLIFLPSGDAALTRHPNPAPRLEHPTKPRTYHPAMPRGHRARTAPCAPA